MKKIYDFKWWQLFIFWSLFYVMLAYIMNNFILTDTWYFNVLGTQLAEDRISELLKMQDKFRWMGYLFVPLVLLIKWLLVAGVLYLAFFLMATDQRYLHALKIVIIAEFAPAVAGIVKTIFLLLYKPATIEELQFFYPLSATQLVNIEKTPLYLSYALQQINAFEILYWTLLMFGVTAFTGKKMIDSFKTVAASYGIALVCWVLIVTFIQLQLS